MTKKELCDWVVKNSPAKECMRSFVSENNERVVLTFKVDAYIVITLLVRLQFAEGEQPVVVILESLSTHLSPELSMKIASAYCAVSAYAFSVRECLSLIST